MALRFDQTNGVRLAYCISAGLQKSPGKTLVRVHLIQMAVVVLALRDAGGAANGVRLAYYISADLQASPGENWSGCICFNGRGGICLRDADGARGIGPVFNGPK